MNEPGPAPTNLPVALVCGEPRLRRILTAVWGPEYRDETQHVRLYVSRLRRKIEPDPENPRYVLTKPGIGYLFAPTA